MALFDFNRSSGGFALRSVHPGFSASDIRSQTGFDYVEPDNVPATPLPDAETLSLLRGKIMDELAETYPAFARSMQQAA
jgi:glutaconate CoA-transferase subunit B